MFYVLLSLFLFLLINKSSWLFYDFYFNSWNAYLIPYKEKSHQQNQEKKKNKKKTCIYVNYYYWARMRHICWKYNNNNKSNNNKIVIKLTWNKTWSHKKLRAMKFAGDIFVVPYSHGHKNGDIFITQRLFLWLVLFFTWFHFFFYFILFLFSYKICKNDKNVQVVPCPCWTKWWGKCVY